MYKAPFELKYPAVIRPEVLKDPEINDRDKIVYAVIASLIGGKEDGYCSLTNYEIGEACGKDERAVKRAISALSAKDTEYIYIDTDRTRVKQNKPIRHIYVDYKYYLNRNKKNTKRPIPNKFKNIHHFRNWAKYALIGFEFKHTKNDGVVAPLKINNNSHLERTTTNETLHPINDKALIYEVWASLYKNKETCIKWVESKNKETK